MTIFSDHVF